MTVADSGFAPPILWSPSARRREEAAVSHYMAWLAEQRGLRFDGYEALWRWSVDDLESFWESIWAYFDVKASEPFECVLASRTMPGAEWFPGARLSYAQHFFRDRDDETVAILHASELRALREWTWGELRRRTAAVAAGLRALGVGPGDRVVAYMPNIPEAVAALLACASLGAVWSSCSPDFGVPSVIDRFAQIEPKVLLAVDGYRYGGRDFDRLAGVARLQRELPTLTATVILGYLGPDPKLHSLETAMMWEDLEAAGEGVALDFAQLPFDHPLWVLYSSGTTGRPKAIVHSQGGVLIEHLKTLSLHIDVGTADRLFWFSTTGWMMWNFLVGGLLARASILLYDGNPGYPDLSVLWELADRAGVTCFGTSAGFITACMKAGIEPRAGRSLSRLRSVSSTGSPLSSDGFRWVYDQLGDEIWLSSASGGTDVCTAFVGGVPTLPVWEGEIQARCLGAKVEAWSEDGRSLTGEVGELVVTETMPSMPVGFWGEDGAARYRESYFSKYPGVWRHGDWIEITERGTVIVSGRSDATINRGGVRMGTSEIYGAVLASDEIVDALVIDVPRPGSIGWMPLFVVPRDGLELTDALRERIKEGIREHCSPRHVPDAILQVPEIPRTISGKVLEVPVRRILMGDDPNRVVARDSMANPDALEWFVRFARQGSERPGASAR